MEATKWIRLPQKKEVGNYMFNGTLYISKKAFNQADFSEISSISKDLRKFVDKTHGVNYLQIYQNQDTGQKVYCMDLLSQATLDNDLFTIEQINKHHLWLMLSPEEYKFPVIQKTMFSILFFLDCL